MRSSARLCCNVSCTHSTPAAERGSSTGFPINLMSIIRDKAYKKTAADGFLLVTSCINRSGRWKRHLSPLGSVSVFRVFMITVWAHVKQPTVSRGYSKLRGRTVHRDLDIHASVRSVGAGGWLWSVSLPLSLPLPALSLFTFICTPSPCCVSDARRLKRQTRFLWRTPRFLFNFCCSNSLRGPRSLFVHRCCP